MPNQNTKAETSLRQLGQRLRQGFAKSNPSEEKSRHTVCDAIRKQWEKEKAEREAHPPERRAPETNDPREKKQGTRNIPSN
jgi:hypothetical protein